MNNNNTDKWHVKRFIGVRWGTCANCGVRGTASNDNCGLARTCRTCDLVWTANGQFHLILKANGAVTT